MRCFVSVLVFCLVAAQTACAGAWLREPDTGFLSISTTIRSLNTSWQFENSLYGEYGLGPRLTLGLDINDITGLAGHVLVFARIPLWPDRTDTKLAVELGIGGHHSQGQWGEMIKTTVSVGRGFASRWGHGWFNVDTAVALRRPDPGPVFKLDATIGLSSGHRIRPLLQFESTHTPDYPLIWSVIPGVMIDGRNDTTWVVGFERKSALQTSLGIKLALWRRF